MYLGAFENQHEQFAEGSFGLLQKSQFLTLLDQRNHHPSNPLECNFQEIFLTTVAPNCSTISNCTQEDRNFEVFSFHDEFFGQSVEHSFFDEQDQKQLPPLQEERSVKSAPEPQILLQEPRVKTDETERDDEPQNCHDETKNIPKNYIKAIFAFILEDQDYMKKLITKLTREGSMEEEGGKQLQRFLEFVRQQKKLKKYTIERLKSLWTHNKTGKAMRIISCEFLRRRSMGYIFGSKIEKKMSHIKHRYKFIRAIQNPAEFTNIK